MPHASRTINQLTKLTINRKAKRVNLSIGQLSIVQSKSFGFTLIELLVVISIIGILASIAVASYGGAQARGRDSRRKTDLDAIKKALELAKQDTTGQYYYPNLLASLAPTYIKTVPLDPKTNANYTYTPTPASCTTTCTNYTLIACLENANDTQGVTDAANCPTSPQKAYTITPN